MAPTVSVIVPSYNYAESLTVCLESIRRQTYTDVEILVVDDCSTDDSVAVAEAAGVRVVSTGVNGGCGTARNVGVAASTGDILCFVDADVALAPDALAEAMTLLTGDERIGVVCGIEDPEPLLHQTLVARYRGLQYHYWSISSEGDVTFLFPAMCVMPRTVYDAVGPFNPALRQTEEVDYGYRVTRRYRMLLTSRVRLRHDHDHRLYGLLRKLFHRGRLRVPLYARARRFATGFETANRAGGSLAAFAALVTTVLPVLAGGWYALLPAALLAASIAADAGMYAFVARTRGVFFLAPFAILQFCVNVTITLGVGVGVLQWLASQRFRALYDSTFPAAVAVLDGTPA
jgi:glycosyltransferase involved in cell wall biosynthesis